ncbi:hypothetical protein AN478_00425 [Thiohalorhabdus denitrificans]|uniref:Uncharacterized protein n=1 Tax=Thiohalorhabdus denitrificans TaxID=381306 RepID=A0A0P9GMI9_9GAMM|nr:hypothetical protein [Thiohalorhabdus denitrificans]KPV41594.1 hypothetical protein AN478_00425 [Thiohalorhabdus denitrificans]SCY57858.1 hypothetical protein SAMN05661077_2586 [Thiohalorhabdus denitrificans]
MEPFDKAHAKDWGYLLNLVGRHAEYGGEPYTVLDVLPEGPQLVLQHAREQSIQSDLQGRPYRRVPRTVCIHTRDTDGNPSDLLDLLYLEDPSQ